MVNKQTFRALILLTVPSLIVVIAVVVLMNWRIPTRVDLDLTVDRVALTVGGTEPAPLLNAGGVRLLTIERFARIAFFPESLAVADPEKYLFEEDRFPETAWKRVKIARPVEVTGMSERLLPKLTFEGVDAKTLGTLELIRSSPGTVVTLEVSGRRTPGLMLKAENQDLDAFLTYADPFYLIADYCQIHGIINFLTKRDSLTLKAAPLHTDPHIEIRGRSNSLMLGLTFVSERASELFTRVGIPVTEIEFSRQGPDGGPETTLVKSGTIRYPDYPDNKAVSIGKSDFVTLQGIEQFRIRELDIVSLGKASDEKGFALHLRMLGSASGIRSGIADSPPKDHRLSRFDVLRQDPSLAALFAVVVWMFPTTLGGYQLYREFGGKGE